MSEEYSLERFRRAKADTEESKKKLSPGDKAKADLGGKAGKFTGVEMGGRDMLGIRWGSKAAFEYNKYLERENRLLDAAHGEALVINETYDRLKKIADDAAVDAKVAAETLETFKRKHMDGQKE